MSDEPDRRDEGQEPVRVVDRRRFRDLDGESAGSDPVAEVPPRKPAYVEELEERLRASDERLQETLSAHRRGRDELTAVRARLERDLEARVSEAKGRVFERILEVADLMDHALEAAAQSGPDDAMAEGLRLIQKKLLETLAREGVERLDLEGQPFDPETAEAIGVVDVADPGQHDRIQNVVQVGYRLGDRILRPARVQVGRHPG